MDNFLFFVGVILILVAVAVVHAEMKDRDL